MLQYVKGTIELQLESDRTRRGTMGYTDADHGGTWRHGDLLLDTFFNSLEDLLPGSCIARPLLLCQLQKQNAWPL
jgi:hypothetical protein